MIPNLLHLKYSIPKTIKWCRKVKITTYRNIFGKGSLKIVVVP
jgi:hypothetical protein